MSRHLFRDGEFFARAEVTPRDDATYIILWSTNAQQLVLPGSHSDRWLGEMLNRYADPARPIILTSSDQSPLSITYLIEAKKLP